jgi:hypothetical protein
MATGEVLLVEQPAPPVPSELEAAQTEAAIAEAAARIKQAEANAAIAEAAGAAEVAEIEARAEQAPIRAELAVAEQAAAIEDVLNEVEDEFTWLTEERFAALEQAQALHREQMAAAMAELLGMIRVLASASNLPTRESSESNSISPAMPEALPNESAEGGDQRDRPESENSKKRVRKI